MGRYPDFRYPSSNSNFFSVTDRPRSASRENVHVQSVPMHVQQSGKCKVCFIFTANDAYHSFYEKICVTLCATLNEFFNCEAAMLA